MKTQQAGSGHHPATGPRTRIDNSDDNARPGRIAIPIVRVLAFAPSGRRSGYLLVVADCPTCGRPHAHRQRPGEPLGVRRAGCGRGVYELAQTVAA